MSLEELAACAEHYLDAHAKSSSGGKGFKRSVETNPDKKLSLLVGGNRTELLLKNVSSVTGRTTWQKTVIGGKLWQL